MKLFKLVLMILMMVLVSLGMNGFEHQWLVGVTLFACSFFYLIFDYMDKPNGKR